jgi:uncharacterized protein YndB with AHSA1/START domain
MSDAAARDTTRVYKAEEYLLIEATIDYPVEKVWPYVLNWQAFVDDHVEYRVAGDPDSEGEIKLVASFDETGRLTATFFLEIVNVVPQKKLVYKVIAPERQYDPVTGAVTEVPIAGYEVFNVREEGGKTLFSLEVLSYEEHPEGISVEEARAISEEYAKSGSRWHEKFFPKLNELLAAEAK